MNRDLVIINTLFESLHKDKGIINDNHGETKTLNFACYKGVPVVVCDRRLCYHDRMDLVSDPKFKRVSFFYLVCPSFNTAKETWDTFHCEYPRCGDDCMGDDPSLEEALYGVKFMIDDRENSIGFKNEISS